MIEARQACCFPFCGELPVVDGYCRKHARIQLKRATRQQLGYDETWLRFRAWYLGQHPLCADCEDGGRVKLANEVHHDKPIGEYPELRLVVENCRALCKSCHTIRENKRKFPSRNR